MGEHAEAVLDATRSAVVWTSSTWLAHKPAPVLGRGDDLGAQNALPGSGQGAEGAVSFEDLEQ